MTAFAAVLACALLGALAVFQAALVFGAPLGRFAWGGRHRVLPRRLRIGSVVSVAVYAVLGCIILARAGLTSPWPPEGAVRAAAWVVAGYFLLGIGMNLASRSTSERAVMTPVVALLCGLIPRRGELNGTSGERPRGDPRAGRDRGARGPLQ